MTDTNLLTIGVLICTYKRADTLARCLTALTAQIRSPDDVIVVVRETDHETRAFLEERANDSLPLRIRIVNAPGLVAARNVGLETCCTDVLAMVDDDTVPHSDWLYLISEHFERNPNLGGLGGRDRYHDGTRFDERRKSVVGKLQWFGRGVGEHHLGFGPSREVDILRGANMTYRFKAIADLRFDVRLRGIGAQPDEDMSFSLAVKRSGWKIVYDPQVLVDHYEGPREEIRYTSLTIPVKDAESFRNLAFNAVVARWDHLCVFRRIVFLVWSIAVGVRVCPGLVQAIRFTPRMRAASWLRFWIAQQGIVLAYLTLMKRGLIRNAKLGDWVH